MSALDQIRASLDQLMGTGRDGENNKYKVRFDDPRVCKSFLLGCCPHETLSSTRMDLGECPKIHDLALKADYEMASASGRDFYYDIDAMEHLQNFINDCDKRTELAKRRLKETQEELSEEATQKAEAIHQLGEKIGTTLASAEDVGKLGNVEESLRLMEEVETLKKEKAAAEIEYRNSMPASSYQQQKLRVCEVCSAFLGIHDNDRRLADHFGGKLHLGFITIRQKLADLQARVQKNAAERRAQREAERESRRLEREEEDRLRREEMERMRAEEEEANRERRSRSHRSRSRERRSRDRRSRSRSRERRRRRSRTRSRSRDRRRKRSRSRSRDRHRRRSRSHHRSRSRSRDRRRRSRSRSRHSHSKRSSHRSRDRSRDRNRSRDKSRDKSREKSQERPKDQEVTDPAPEAADGREAGTSGLEMAVGAAPAQD